MAALARKKPQVILLMGVKWSPIFLMPGYTHRSMIGIRSTMKSGLKLETMSLGTPPSFITAAYEVKLFVIWPYASR